MYLIFWPGVWPSARAQLPPRCTSVLPWSMEQSLGSVVLEYALLIVLILVVEKILASMMAFVLRKLLGLQTDFKGWVLMVILSPYIHHASHFVPVVGHVLTTFLLARWKANVYLSSATGEPSSLGIGFVLVFARILFHYVVVILGLAAFAGRLFADLKGLM